MPSEAVNADHIGELLDRVPGMREPGTLGRLVDWIEKRYPGLGSCTPGSAWVVCEWLVASTVGFEPLLDAVRMRQRDWFPPATLAVVALTEALERICESSRLTSVERRRRWEEVRSNIKELFASVQPDPRVLREAYRRTVTRHGALPTPPVVQTGFGFGERLLELADTDGAGVEYVLDFLALVERDLQQDDPPWADQVRVVADRIAGGEPALADALAAARTWADQLAGRLRSTRPHLLFRIEAVSDADPDVAAGCRYNVTAWFYVDDYSAGSDGWLSTSESYGVPMLQEEVPSSSLPETVARHVAEHEWQPDLVVELMKEHRRLDDDRADTWPYGDEPVRLGERFAVVLRPLDVPVGDPEAWFRNWISISAGGQFQTGPDWHRLCGCAAVVLNGSGPTDPAEAVATLVRSGVPVVAWRRGGKPVGAFGDGVSFHTPIILRRQREQGRGQEIVLVWHNPHWMPEGGELWWRGTDRIAP